MTVPCSGLLEERRICLQRSYLLLLSHRTHSLSERINSSTFTGCVFWPLRVAPGQDRSVPPWCDASSEPGSSGRNHKLPEPGWIVLGL